MQRELARRPSVFGFFRAKEAPAGSGAGKLFRILVWYGLPFAIIGDLLGTAIGSAMNQPMQVIKYSPHGAT